MIFQKKIANCLQLILSQTLNEGKRKEFVCSLCYAEFSRKDNYTIHVATVHEGQKPFKCSECDSSFPRKGELTKHIMFCHQGFIN